MPTYLDSILRHHRARVAAGAASAERAIDAARAATSAVRDIAAALRQPGVSVIAEIKRRSPSKGVLSGHLRVEELAATYAVAGAAALSVLTDEAHFGGSADDLATARAAVELPVLRKDFTVAPVDVAEARLMGADAVLLIAAALDDSELADLHALAGELGLAAVVETHDEEEVERALRAGAAIVGVNQRDLATFEVDDARAVRVARAIPSDVVRVAESGIRGPDDVARLAEAGYDAFLVGEHLVTAPDPAVALRRLVRACS